MQEPVEEKLRANKVLQGSWAPGPGTPLDSFLPAQSFEPCRPSECHKQAVHCQIDDSREDWGVRAYFFIIVDSSSIGQVAQCCFDADLQVSSLDLDLATPGERASCRIIFAH